MVVVVVVTVVVVVVLLLLLFGLGFLYVVFAKINAQSDEEIIYCDDL